MVVPHAGAWRCVPPSSPSPRVFVRNAPKVGPNRLPGTTLLGTFLVATISLSVWLAYQALDAAHSHRRTAEATLRDHASISAWELTRRTRDNLEDVLDEVFDPVYREIREAGLPPATVVGRDLDDAMREQRCSCRAFRRPMALFRVLLPSGESTSDPSSLSIDWARSIAQRIVAGEGEVERRRDGILVVDGEGTSPEPVVVGYTLSRNGTPGVATIYGFVVSREAMSELILEWYEDARLLPRPLAGNLPNDSLLTVTVRSLDGVEVFASPARYPETFAASDTLGPDLGSLVVQAAVRPDQASRLVIGGLPKSRLPLLITLLVLTLGVGGAALLQIRRERELALLREDFVSGVSHELRTPLAQIRMFAELQDTGRLSSDDDRARAAAVINREARRLTHLVENILQYSRLRRAPGKGLPEEAVDVGEVFSESLEAVRPLADARGALLIVDGDRSAKVLANRAALSQILVNLLDNAIKYGPTGQTVEATVEPRDGVVRFQVDDEGPGIPPQDRARVWEPYRRLERDIQSRLPGTGIGLAVVERLARLHGGRAWVEDAPGGGARFVFELPRAADAPPTDLATEAEESLVRSR